MKHHNQHTLSNQNIMFLQRFISTPIFISRSGGGGGSMYFSSAGEQYALISFVVCFCLGLIAGMVMLSNSSFDDEKKKLYDISSKLTFGLFGASVISIMIGFLFAALHARVG